MNVKVDTNCDKTLWDEYVSSSSNGHFMQSHAWGMLQQQFGWKAMSLLARDGNTIKGGALLLSRPIPLLGRNIFYAPRGPVANHFDGETTAALCDVMMETIKRGRGIFLRCDPYVPENGITVNLVDQDRFRQVHREWSYWNAPKFVFWLDLKKDEETLLSNMTSSCRSEVRLGYKKGVVFERGGRKDLDEFYRLMCLTGRNKSIAVHGADYYRRLYDTVNLSARMELFLARYEGKIIATGMSVCYGEKAWLLYAASDREYYRFKPNRTLQWEMIKWARSEGCARYDFRGTATGDPPSTADPGYGVYEYKKSFGPKFTRLEGYYDLVANPTLYQIFRHGEEKGLPLAYRIKTWFGEVE
jgi:peptidoglycan pentaglycine glycine transferase (the first glycine)